MPPAEPQADSPHERPKPTRAQRLVAFMFLGAFGLTMITVVYTGLSVRSPSARRAAETPVIELTAGVPRTINLVFDARAAVAEVEFTVDLPAGVEVAESPGQARVSGHAPLAAGANVLPLLVVARSGQGGVLAARLRQGGDQKTFVVELTVAPR